MAQLAVDSEGKRIKTDILVCGFIREGGTQCELLIPDDINTICFLFWFIKVCDEWDKKYLADGVEINGQMMKAPDTFEWTSVYGRHSIDKGSYTWEVTIKASCQWFSFGLIEDKPDILEEFIESINYVDAHGCVLHDNGKFYRGSTSPLKDYSAAFEDADAKITMTLDMDNHTLRYIVNGKDYGVVTDKLDKKKYRMVVTVWNDKDGVELL